MAETKAAAKPFDAKAEAAAIEAYFAKREQATAPAWRPEIDETLFGEVIGLRMGNSIDYGPYPIVVVRTEFGPRSIHAFHTLLREQLKEMECKPGTKLAVTYMGEQVTNATKDKPEKDQVTYHQYFAADMDKVTRADVATVEEGFTFDTDK